MSRELIGFPLAFPSNNARQQHWNRIERYRITHNTLHADDRITWQEAREIVDANRDAAQAKIDAYKAEYEQRREGVA